MSTTATSRHGVEHEHRGASATDGRSLWATAAVVAVGSVLVGLDTSLVNVGLNSIATDLDATLTTAQWVNSGYLLALAAALPVCVWVSRRVGAGRLWLWSLVGFTVASALCGVAPDVVTLIVARVLQGLAGGLLIPAGMTLLGQVAGSARMGRVIAISSVPSILAPAVGPVIGSLLIADLSWRWLFLVNAPIGLIGLLLGLRWVPRGTREASGRLDWPGLALVVPGLPLVVYGITEATDSRSTLAWQAWIALGVGLVLLVAFVRRSLHTRQPLLDLRLGANRVFGAAAFEIFFAGACLFGGLIVMPLYFQLQLGRGIVEAGLLLMPFSLGAAITFPLAGWANDRFGGGIVAVVGAVLTIASTAPMAVLGQDPDLLTVEVLQVLRGIGLALAGSPGVSSALATVRAEQMPDATAQVNILSRVGGALGSALFTVVLAGAAVATATADDIDHAFTATFWWLTAVAVVTLAAAVALTIAQRRAATERPAVTDS